ncbi:NAD-glutamate dehydrogenase [Aurantimonas sp. Leaf443]|uniref:NAD-glutamate dehydrogenase n=1 Tax=Aurantimonas sp. Leaf443 TaxID=1736378 RepID=UPI0006F65580|nr:NAD-glutamate dehydrogenase [Aurantimonas sp. Leaf443]KQT85521.1 NAD-glutamate dehydrogenase [Aurantimonas sp. Leaf443]
MLTEIDPGKAERLEAIARAAGGTTPEAALVPLLFARPPAEDLASLDPAVLAAAARAGLAALKAHRPGTPIVRIETVEDPNGPDAPLAVVTIVNDDMPFLFDSVMAEIAERAAGLRAVSHPILDVSRGADGSMERFAASRVSDRSFEGDDRVSLIQTVVAATDDEDTERLRAALSRILVQVGAAVRDFSSMRARVDNAVAAMHERASALADSAQAARVREAAAFLQWLRDDNFIFLGAREYVYHDAGEGEALERRDDAGLGILSDPDVRILGRAGRPLTVTPEIRAFLNAPEPLVVTKANSRSLVHRRAYMDYVGIKEYDAAGNFAGELRIVGLFTSSAYTQSILTIPYLRRKAQTVIEDSGFRPGSHSGKAVLNALESYPRDEMFQIDAETLERFVATVVELGERPRVRVLPRIDRFHRFVSVLVFVPRERYDSRLRERIGLLLAERYDGHVSAYYPAFPEGLLARVHFIVGRRGGETPMVDPHGLEQRIAEMARNWEDDFDAALRRRDGARALAAYVPGLPDSYRDLVAPQEAVTDVSVVSRLTADAPLSIDFYRRPGDGEDVLRLKIYHLGEPVDLSTRVPILEAMGFSVGSERTFRLVAPQAGAVFLHDMDLSLPRGGPIRLSDQGVALEETFAAVSAGRIENDGFNALVLAAGLDHRRANMLRAYARYLRQAGLPYSPDYLAGALVRQPQIAQRLAELFERAFSPDAPPAGPVDAAIEPGPRRRAAERGGLDLYDAVIEALDAVSSADDDRILRRFLGAILATLRTNYYAVDGLSSDPASQPGAVEPALAFKLDSAAVEGLPEPVPYREIFVFDARVEGVHLRFGPVARGGLRWSDRAQDYRTEVLGLVKAQQVKNAVIVPVGSKGGFYPKRLPDASDRDAWFAAGRSAYVVFIASLLSVTDTIVGAGVKTPERVRAYDGEDPYFVVAADKGTATFSDTANAIATSEGFWLGDAFASGGSAGYDHKAMGITARGAWEAVKRHFRELKGGDKAFDIQAEPFTVAGCGDMSGDVFGNGMLLSRQARLVAAFDHRDIFIDPDPDPETSFEERARLFALPRSSWADYDAARISAGGGVFSRRQKEIRLSPEAAEAIGWDRRSGTPAEVIAAILKSPVDLLWFGGIGTYVRAASEPNADVGDRANDPLRVTAEELRAKVIGEGANLGVTQKGRIAFARGGGRINTDAIDNSAGVNTSDVEVNIKIALKSATEAGRLDPQERNAFLASMTDEVADLVLANNYEQTLALSLEERRGAAGLSQQARFMTVLEEEGRLNRAVEYLPTDGAIADLRASGKGLTRPELAVLLAYAKIALFDAVVASDLPDDPYLEDRLADYFPAPMRHRFAHDIAGHRLAREIVATVLANETVNRLGTTFVTVMRDATGASPGRIVRAFVAAHDGLDARSLIERVDALDAAVPGAIQNELYAQIGRFLARATYWHIQNGRFEEGLTSLVVSLRDGLQRLRGTLFDKASERSREEIAARRSRFTEAGVPGDLAEEIALLPLLALIPDIASVSRETDTGLEETIEAYFAVTGLFEIGRLESALGGLSPSDYYEILALMRADSQIAGARRRLTAQALSRYGTAQGWADSHRDGVERISRQIAALAGSGETSVARLTVAAGLLADLAAE